MNPRVDKVARVIYLDKLRRSLTFIKYEELDLRYLTALRDEVDTELLKLAVEDGIR